MLFCELNITSKWKGTLNILQVLGFNEIAPKKVDVGFRRSFEKKQSTGLEYHILNQKKSKMETFPIRFIGFRIPAREFQEFQHQLILLDQNQVVSHGFSYGYAQSFECFRPTHLPVEWPCGIWFAGGFLGNPRGLSPTNIRAEIPKNGRNALDRNLRKHPNQQIIHQFSFFFLLEIPGSRCFFFGFSKCKAWFPLVAFLGPLPGESDSMCVL